MFKSAQEQAAEIRRSRHPAEAQASDARRAAAAAQPPAETAAIEALEYACTIEADNRRGVWVKAYVEQQNWAIRDFVAWLDKRRG